LALILLYTYYSAQVFYLGAEFTQVYGRTYGTRRAEHQLIEQAIPATPQQTIQDPSGTIVPVSTSPGGIPPDLTPNGDDQEISSATSLRRQRLQRVARPVAQAGAALGVIALLSVVNLVAAPLRRDRK
jgi:hypothetical protein